MTDKIVKFGGDPDNDGEEMAEFKDRNGSTADIRAVSVMRPDTIRACLMLWTAGATYADIAAQFNFRSPMIAQLAIERALSENVDDTVDRTKMRRRMSLTLDRLMRAVMPKAIDVQNPEQLPAVRVALTIVERYARLNGLDAPQQVDVTITREDEMITLVNAAARGLDLDVPVEADIFSDEYMYEDAEVIDDGEPGAGAEEDSED